MNSKQLIPIEDNLSDTGVSASAEGGGAQMVREQPAAQLFPDTECHDFRARWERIQIGFVDEPRRYGAVPAIGEHAERPKSSRVRTSS